MNTLSFREVQIIRYTAKGFTAKEIAKALGLEYRTVEVYASNIRKKLAAKNIAHAVYIAVQKNIITEPV
jgi:two-component system invasion response regulator UvrY